jgi:hypothetical protein
MTAASSDPSALEKPGPLFFSVTSPQPIIPQLIFFTVLPLYDSYL